MSPLSVCRRLSSCQGGFLSSASSSISREWIHRLDCADLIDRMQHSLEKNGFEWGKAWYYPTFMLYGAISDPQQHKDLKRDAMTTSKAYLIEQHTDLDLRDYYSCALTDAYAILGCSVISPRLCTLGSSLSSFNERSPRVLP